ncbi:hypothetical protein HanRHA438_Chr14g0635021 [Helianthus annuus]|nr:hypothetical protein HanRHA438_Chr14g0635021 [Helianthus annuus]
MIHGLETDLNWIDDWITRCLFVWLYGRLYKPGDRERKIEREREREREIKRREKIGEEGRLWVTAFVFQPGRVTAVVTG